MRPGRAAARPGEGSGRVGLAPAGGVQAGSGWRPARVPAARSWRPMKGRAVSATARAGCGRARDGRGCGEWRNRRGRVTGASRNRHRRGSSSQRRREVLTSSRLPPTLQRRGRLWGCYGDPKVDSASRTSENGLLKASKCDVPGISRESSSRIRAPGPHFRAERSRKCELRVGLPQHPGNSSRESDFLPSLCRLPGEPLTSRASRGGHSLPGPPRDARDATRTAATRPEARAANAGGVVPAPPGTGAAGSAGARMPRASCQCFEGIGTDCNASAASP